jgi:hypothetical protein
MSEPFLIITLLLSGTSLIFGYFKAQEKKKRIVENGVEVKGVVYEYDNISFNDEPIFPKIRFVTKEGLWVTEYAEYSLSRDLIKEGQEVIVIYNEENPKEFIYKTSSIDLSKLVYLLIIIGVGLLAVGLWVAYKYLTNES